MPPSASTLAVVTLGLTLLGCGSNAPPPRISAVTPAQAAEGQAVDVVVTGEGFFAAVVTDFRRPAASSIDTTVVVALVSDTGAVLPLDQVALEDSSTVRAQVPATTPRGLYDVRLEDARGAQATLPGAFTVVTPAESVAAFTVEPIASQAPGVPFAVRLLAVDASGQLVDSFEGPITLSDTTGTLAPATPRPLVRGRLTAFVTVSDLATGNVVHAADALGHQGSSGPFDVVPGPAARLGFATAPTEAPAAACAGPFRLELGDQLGFPVPAPVDQVVTLSTSPAGALAFFHDATCSAATTTVTVAAGQSSTELYARGTVAGPMAVRATPQGYPTAAHPFTVQPGPAAAITFTAPPTPLRAGRCSPPLDITAEDVFGNASPPPHDDASDAERDPGGGAGALLRRDVHHHPGSPGAGRDAGVRPGVPAGRQRRLGAPRSPDGGRR